MMAKTGRLAGVKVGDQLCIVRTPKWGSDRAPQITEEVIIKVGREYVTTSKSQFVDRRFRIDSGHLHDRDGVTTDTVAYRNRERYDAQALREERWLEIRRAVTEGIDGRRTFEGLDDKQLEVAHAILCKGAKA